MTVRFWYVGDRANAALIVPESSSYGPLLPVGVVGAGSRAVPHASDKVRWPPFPLPATTSVPNALKVRSNVLAMGSRTSVRCVCNSETELCNKTVNSVYNPYFES